MQEEKTSPGFDGTEDILQQGDTTDTSEIAEIGAGHFDLNELAHMTSAEASVHYADTVSVLDTALDIIRQKVSETGYVTLHGFGSFTLKTLAPESGFDPQGKAYAVAERVTVEFNPHKKFRQKLTEITGIPAIS